MTLSHRDKNLIWHPFTQEKTSGFPIAIKKGHGSYVYDENGKSYLDLISSWWVNLHGHCHPEIASKIYQQAQTLEHVMFAGFTHEPAVSLCENLQKILPQELNKFFFSDNGSTSIEVAIKMAYQYWHNQGEVQKKYFISFEGGYHGDTFGSMSIGHKSGFHNHFKDLFFKVLSVPFPDTWKDDESVKTRENQAIEILENYIKKYSNEIVGLVIEPMVQGASGMRMCSQTFMKKVCDICKQNQILIIFDEVMTGFGRTGKNFAFEHIGITPDFICLSKGLTGGFLPLALTVTKDFIYKAFLNDDWNYTFTHGHSYTANPIACASALASLEILERPTTKQSIENINKAHNDGISYLSDCKIEKSRILGTICAFEIDNVKHYQKLFTENGMIIRPLGNTVYLIPPYCIDYSTIISVYARLKQIFTSH
jgi:adenosylmethionine-8-amino-7-oxononanoate aminotransferase